MTEQATPAISIDLSSILNQAKEFKEASGGPSFAKTAFLPNGNHQGRFIISPDGRLYEQYDAYGYFGRGTRTPEYGTGVPEGFEDKIRSLYWNVLKPLNQWKYGTQKVHLLYFYLTATDSTEADRWEAGNLYALYLRPKHMKTILAWINTMAKDDPSTITQGFNPDHETNAVSLSVVDGNISISVKYPLVRISPVDLKDQAYVNLSHAYIAPEFNLEKYNALLSSYIEIAKGIDPKAVEIWEAEGVVPDSYWEAQEEGAEDNTPAQTPAQAQATAQPAVEVQAQPVAQPSQAPVQQAAPVEQPVAVVTQAAPVQAAIVDASADPFARFAAAQQTQ